MSLFDDYNFEDEILTTTRTEQFSKLLHELEHRTEDEKKQKIEEMNGLIDEMNEKEFESVFTKELYHEMGKMIEKNTLSWGNAILLMKHVGYCKELKCFFCDPFGGSLLSKKMSEMIIYENEKTKDEKDEILLIELCECFALLIEDFITKKFLSINMPCLLKILSKKDESEEVQKDVEMALLVLSNANTYCMLENEIYLNEIKEIIKYHQEHHNLTQLSYQCAWNFLINKIFKDISLEEVIVNKLHFGREARREIEELTRCIDWKKKEEENERIEVSILRRWLNVIDNYFSSCELWNEELVGLISCIVQVFKAARGRYQIIRNKCLYSLMDAAIARNVKIEDLLKSGAIDFILEEMKQSTLDDKIMSDCLHFFLNISKRLKEKDDGETDETKRKELKRKIFEKMEEEGFEDITTSLYGVISFLNNENF
eukprot:MONOS_12414.1-p1 / transcript=MONOS_12414.1 / gene=MONOS_12414 / organism=Monocercomonoides_exilis_PA203 / gene_product=unspecified product / transcript_product=unspecified product / location=Mono_scaffold00686:29983-31391(-) / protein_length=428 / sequence_SO=supercontig / SO=protein_coding / is_pseudo=false